MLMVIFGAGASFDSSTDFPVPDVANFDLKLVRELVGARPSLTRAAWDWGFGDWETALGAASHMGNRPIAARPSMFSAAMLGQLEVVKAFVAAQPGAQRILSIVSTSVFAFSWDIAGVISRWMADPGNVGALK